LRAADHDQPGHRLVSRRESFNAAHQLRRPIAAKLAHTIPYIRARTGSSRLLTAARPESLMCIRRSPVPVLGSIDAIKSRPVCAHLTVDRRLPRAGFDSLEDRRPSWQVYVSNLRYGGVGQRRGEDSSADRLVRHVTTDRASSRRSVPTSCAGTAGAPGPRHTVGLHAPQHVACQFWRRRVAKLTRIEYWRLV
jgi:hypothetical protein